MENNLFFKLNFLLLILIPIALLTGPFLQDLICSVTGLVLIYLYIRYKIYKYLFSRFFLFFSLFYLFFVLSSLLSNNILFSFESSLFYFRFGVMSLSIWLYCDYFGLKFIKPMTISLLISILIAISSGYSQYFFGIDYLGNPLNQGKDGIVRISGIFGDEFVLGSFISRLLPTSLALLYLCFIKKNFFQYFIVIYLISSVILIILTGERSAVVNVILFIILFLILIKINIKIKLFILLLSVFSILIILISDDRINNRLINKTYNDLTNNGKNIYLITKDHQEAIQTSLKMFKNNILIGIGPKMFRIECFKPEYYVGSDCQMHPHNTYFQLLSETGIVGFMSVLFIFLYLNYLFINYLFNKNFTNKQIINNYKLLLLISVYITLWPINQNGNFFNNWISIIYFFPVGFILSKSYLR